MLKKEKIAYIDAYSGVSGNMLLGALIDLGFPRTRLQQLKKALGLDAIKISIKKAEQNNLAGVLVKISGEKNPPKRNLSRIRKIIRSAQLPKPVKEKSIKAFQLLAEAEAKIHSCSPEQVHFHELGAVDTIMDIVGVILGFYELGIEKIYASKIPLATGEVECAHGRIPLPAPATLELLKGIPVKGINTNQELTTPTGAVLLRVLAEGFGSIPEMTLEKIGYGLGEKNLGERANLLRILIGKTHRSPEELFVFESTIDDMNPEYYQPLLERLFQAGALEVALVPAYLKKNRPGIILKGLTQEKKLFQILEQIFLHSTTLGVRYYPVARWALSREEVKIKTRYGLVRAKKLSFKNQERIYPEFEDLKKLAEKFNLSIIDLEAEVKSQWEKIRKKPRATN